ncbi:MAG: hypothetical protein JST86_06550 [Bacteroidetes bacterium]|nr:hypothetical protein [Bacteroidota bacterium]
MKNCNCNSDITRDGSGQLGRYLKALDPSYAPVDGRSLEDLLVQAKRYAAQVRFYDMPGTGLQDSIPADKISWKEFFRRDMAVLAASVAVTQPEDFKKEFDEVNERLQQHATADVFAALFAPVAGMLKKMDRWFAIAIPGNPLYEDLKLAIDSNLKMQVQKIAAYKEGFKYVDPAANLDIDLAGVEHQSVWGLDGTIPPDSSIYTGTTVSEKIVNGALFVEDIFHAFYTTLTTLITASEKYFQYALQTYPGHQPHMALFITFLQLFQKAQQQMNGLTGRLLDFYYKDVLQLQTKPSVPDKAYVVFELAKDVTEYPLHTGTSLSAGPDASGKEQVYATNADLVVNQAKVKELKTIFVQKEALGTATEKIKSVYSRPVANSKDGLGAKFDSDDTKWPTFGLGAPPVLQPKNTCEKIDYLKQLLSRNDEAKVGFAVASPQILMQGGKRLVEIKLGASATPLLEKIQVLSTAGDTPVEIWFTGEKEWFKVDAGMKDADQARFTKFLDAGVYNPLANDIGASYYADKTNNSLVVYLPPSSPAVIAYDAAFHAAYNYPTQQPVMQVLLSQEIDIKSSTYKEMLASGIKLRVKVGSVFPANEQNKSFQEIFKEQGVTAEEAAAFQNFRADGLNKLVLQNETQGVLPIGKPFDPFSAYPDEGKSFYIGSEEIFNKPLGQLAFTVKRTSEFAALKAEAAVASRQKDYSVSILESRGWTDLCTPKGNDFNQVTIRSNILFQTNGTAFEASVSATPVLHPRLPLLPVTEWQPDTVKGFVRFTNLHAVGSTENYMQDSQALAHTLEVKEVSASYESELVSFQSGIDEFYHAYPFGVVETYIGVTNTFRELLRPFSADNTGILPKLRLLRNSAFEKADAARDYLLVKAGNILLPQFTWVSPYDAYADVNNASVKATTGNTVQPKELNTLKKVDPADQLILGASGLLENISGGNSQYTGNIQEEGMLFIGLENAQPLQMVSMLFQFAEGSAADEDNDPPEIHWAYCTNNEWRPLKQESLVADGTAGFQTTGIIKIEIPADATKNNTIITTGLYWLCASVTQNSDRIPMLIDIVTQAVEAGFKDNNNSAAHFDKALPAGSISKLTVGAAEIATVKQPFASYDGKHAEVGKEFYTRVSERLRHKARAVTPWDYEHLVLNRFPSIYKVKCITHTDPNCLCRHEDEPAPAPAATGCGIGSVNINYLENSGELTGDADRQVLNDVVSKMSAGTNCTVSLTAFAAKGDARSLAINTKRVEAVAEAMISKGIAAPRFTKSVEQTTEQNRVTIADTTPATAAPAPGAAPETICCGPQAAPGHVLIVPVSNLKNRNAVNPLQPKTARRVLLDIEAYLSACTSPFVKVHAKNPVYEQVLVFFRVKFYAGFDRGFYMRQLNDEIVHYLTPWAFDENADVQFGQKIYASSIINFIEEREYVDFITDFLMVVCRDACCDDVTAAVDEKGDANEVLGKISGCCDMELLLQDQSDFAGDIIAKPSTPRSLLVSAPKHIIIPYEEPEVLSPCEIRKLHAVVQPQPSLQDRGTAPAVATITATETPKIAPAVAKPAVVKKTVKTTKPARVPRKPNK